MRISTMLRGIKELKNLKGKRVLVRASLNVPFSKEGVLLDDFRLQKTLPTIEYLREHGARVIVCGHLGRDAHMTLGPIFHYLQKHIDGIQFAHDVTGPSVTNAVGNLNDGDVLLLENLRRCDGETANDLQFAEELADLADIYVNDAFSVSHREHASIVGIPFFLPAYAGMLFKDEYDQLQYARDPEHPALFILGGAKFETKQPLVEKFLTIYDHVFVTGALANDFFAAGGHSVGRSLVSDPPVNVKHLLTHPKILLPQDVMVLTIEGEKVVKKPEEVEDGDMINDAGPETMKMLEPIIKQAKFILWNGPLGDYQLGFVDGTKSLVELISRTKPDSVVGGGDTMSLITKFGYDKQFSFCSTAGGSMLEFLLKGTIPGIMALERSANRNNAK